MIAVTHPGKIGDTLYSLPTVEKLSEIHNTKVDFYTSDFCKNLESFILYQPYINNFYISPGYTIQHMSCGVQPWQMPVHDLGYTQVYHLGFKSFPHIPLHAFIARQTGVEVTSIEYFIPDYETLKEPYITLCCHGDVRYLDIYKEFIDHSSIPVVNVGAKHEYLGIGIDKTGMDFLDTAVWISKSIGFIGAGATYVLAEGFPIPKILPHDGRSFDLSHVIHDPYHKYPINPTYTTFIKELGFMHTLSKTLKPDDYSYLTNHVQHILNILDHLKHNNIEHRFEHEHRKWEYGLAYKAVDSPDIKTIMDVGGGGSIFAPAMGWIGKDVLTVDPGDVGKWISNQSSKIGNTLRFVQEDFSFFETEELFDAVVSLSVIEHVYYDLDFFKKLLKFVKPGGILVLTTDFHPSGNQIVGGHVRTYNKETLLNLGNIAKEYGFDYYKGNPDYEYFGAHVNGCDFASLVLRRGFDEENSTMYPNTK